MLNDRVKKEFDMTLHCNSYISVSVFDTPSKVKRSQCMANKIKMKVLFIRLHARNALFKNCNVAGYNFNTI